jgi:hypothetical protein
MKLLSDIEWACNLLEKKKYVIPRIKNSAKSIAAVRDQNLSLGFIKILKRFNNIKQT